MIDELFPTGWHLIATTVALGGILLTAGIWIGNINSDRKSFKEFMKEVKAKLELLGQSLEEVKLEQRSFSASLEEVKLEQRSFGDSLKEVQAEQRSFGDSLKEVQAEQRSFRESLEEVKAEQRTFGESLKQVEEKITNIPERLLSPAVVETNSPIKLSDFGRKISANLSVDRWAADHALRLVNKASGKQEFEIFEMCVKYVADQFDSDLDLNKYSRKGAYEVGTDVEKVKRVYAVELRDALLAHLDPQILKNRQA